MEVEEAAEGDALDADHRLARLAARRAAAAAVNRRRTSAGGAGSASDGEEGEASLPPLSGAVLALRELLQERQGAFDGVAMPDPGSGPPMLELPTAAPPPRATTPQLAISQPGSRHATPSCHQQQQLHPRPASAAPHQPVATPGSSRPGSAASGARRSATPGGAPGETARPSSQLGPAGMPGAQAATQTAEAQRADLAALLARQQAATVERQRQRLEREARLQRARLELATHHMAAWRIARGWRRFLHSPGRLRAVAAATRIQAAWRGFDSRRRTALLLERHRRRQALLAQLHASVAACCLVEAQAAAAKLRALGARPDPGHVVAALERRAAEAAQVLREAAELGGAEEFSAAAAEAQRYHHLAAAAQQAAAQFARRVAAAEQALHAAVADGSLVRCREASAAAAALGVSDAVLHAAQQRAVQRNQQAAAALQAAGEASPFKSAAFTACLERAQRFGLLADVARAQRGLQLRRHRTAGSMPQLAAERGAAEVEAACCEAAELGLDAEARAACVVLEQRQAAAAVELQQAAGGGTLEEFEAAVQHATWLGLGGAVLQAGHDQLRLRQQEVERLLRQAAEGGSAAAAVQRSMAALALGLGAAVAAAEGRVNARRALAVELLLARTREACGVLGRGCGGAELEGWMGAARDLQDAARSSGAAAALAQPPAACSCWPPELAAWLGAAQQAALLELEAPLVAAVAALLTGLEASLAAAQVTAVPLQPAARQASSCSSRGSGPSGQPLAQQCAPPPVSPLPSNAVHLLCQLREWRALQEGIQPLVAALHAESDGEDGAAPQPATSCALDVSRQGLNSLELLAGSCSLTSLDISGNALTCLRPLAALGALRELRAGSNALASLEGVQALRALTALEAAHNRLEHVPSLAGLARLRRLDLSANRLGPAALRGAGLPAVAARLTCLRLGGNPLGDLAGWAGPMPCLLHLDVSNCGLPSLDGLATAAPLLQVLLAPRNRLQALPPDLHLPLLRELWLGGNRLGSVTAWPWLPSLRLLRLEENGLRSLAPLQGFPLLRALDLSLNALASLAGALHALAPLAGALTQLRLNDNPLAAAAQAGQPGGYQGAALRALPLLRELNSQPVGAAAGQQAQRGLEAERRWLPVPAAATTPAAGQAGAQLWDAHTVLWLLGDGVAAQQALHARAQKQALDAAAQVQAEPCSAQAAALAASLAGLQRAAAIGDRLPTAAAWSPLQQAQARYLLLADGLPAAQGLLLLEPAHFRQRLAALAAAATRVQASWRRHAARRLLWRLAAERQARMQAGAAACIQAAWRGWACRRSHLLVLERLGAWRGEWREAQRQLLELQQCYAATRVQAAWRGWRVRRLLAAARASVQHQCSSWDAELSCASLTGLLEGALADAWDAPEVLQPGVTAHGQQARQAAPHLPALLAAGTQQAGTEGLSACGSPAEPAGWLLQDTRSALYEQLWQKQAAAARRRGPRQQQPHAVGKARRQPGSPISSKGLVSSHRSSLDWSLPALPTASSPRAAGAAHAAAPRRVLRASPPPVRTATSAAGPGPSRQRSCSGGRASMPCLRLHTVQLDS